MTRPGQSRLADAIRNMSPEEQGHFFDPLRHFDTRRDALRHLARERKQIESTLDVVRDEVERSLVLLGRVAERFGDSPALKKRRVDLEQLRDALQDD